MKNIKKENRSVKKTKEKLKEGLILLLNEKPTSEVKVKELCELVDINRGTFYYHYTDVFDLLRKVQEEFLEEFNNIIIDMNIKTIPKQKASIIIEKVFSFFDKNAKLSEVLLGPNGDMGFIQQIKESVDEKCSDIWKDAGSHMKEEEYELFNSYIINGFIGMLETWLKNGRVQSPKYMSNFVATMIIPAAVYTLALDSDVLSREKK